MARARRTLTGSPAVPIGEAAARLGGASGRDGLDAGRRAAARRFPVRLTRHYLDLADPNDPTDPIRRIAWPDPGELAPDAGALDDPVGERRVTPVPFVVRKHRDRAVLLVAARCHVYCRFCFRRTFPDGAHRDPSARELEAALDYLRREADLREVILSGGDPLVLPDDVLRGILAELSAMPQLERLRVHTRAPVHDPSRVTPGLARALSSGLPLRVVMHFDHPREMTAETRRVESVLSEAGIAMLNQSVLLAGVNDDPALLEALCRALVRHRIEPYYLHHPDRVPGAGSFWVPIARGLEIYRELRARLGEGVAAPAYVIDPPDGSGKVPVEEFARTLDG